MVRSMEYLRGRREIFTTFEIDKLSAVMEILKKNGIEYNVLTDDSGPGRRGAGLWLSLFGRTKCRVQYYVFVKKELYEKAKSILAENYRG